MGFSKLDDALIQSSLMSEPPHVFKVFLTMVSLAKADHVARVSATFLAAVCYMSQEQIDDALQRLQDPDPRSRTEVDEGRRIKKIDGGYFIINHAKYRADTRSEYLRLKQAKAREKARLKAEQKAAELEARRNKPEIHR